MKKAFFLSLLAFSVFISDCEAARFPKKKSLRISRSVPKAGKIFSAKPLPVKKKNADESINANEIQAQQALLIDFDDGECLYGKNSDERCVPSSMTKLMTIYLLFEAITKGELRMDDELPVSELAQSKEGSRSFFKAGTLASVEDLIRSIIVHSGNDACTVVAEKISGSEEAFAELMNEKAEMFGLKNTHFTNATGLPDADHYSSAEDLAVIAKHLLSDFPQYYHYFSEKTFTVNDITQENRNTLLGNSLNVDGLKTGKTDAGGYGIVVSAKKSGKRLIGVVNGCKSVRQRTVEANKLLGQGFNAFINVAIAKSHQSIGNAKVSVGKSDAVGICVHEDISIPILKKYKNSIVVELNVNEPIEAPIAAGDKLGTMIFKYGTFVSQTYDVFALDDVPRLTMWERARASVLNLFSKSPKETTPAASQIPKEATP
ncbi:MAG: D-alanyl-D-alanine carboxypeptidase [Holosporaceae bacterium]|jgi:D-alanyl-D-alanine carboxypeptidase (penicillin-binding protein 5/6)|nr:D-alanyl-D-alanine carboxypeptidase [Holosporaceae bacterium]